MFVLNLLRVFADKLLFVYELLFIARALISWFPMLQGNSIVEFLYAITEPILKPIRTLLMRIPFLQGFPLDFSVLVAFLLIDVLREIIFRI